MKWSIWGTLKAQWGGIIENFQIYSYKDSFNLIDLFCKLISNNIHNFDTYVLTMNNNNPVNGNDFMREISDIIQLSFLTLNMFIREGEIYQKHCKTYNNILKLINTFLEHPIYSGFMIRILIDNYLDTNRFRNNFDSGLNIIYIFSRSFTFDPLLVSCHIIKISYIFLIYFFYNFYIILNIYSLEKLF